MVVGGEKLAYPDDPASPAANLLDTKLIINSTISDSNKGARFMTVDVKTSSLDLRCLVQNTENFIFALSTRHYIKIQPPRHCTQQLHLHSNQQRNA